MNKKPNLTEKLEDNKLWQMAAELAAGAYATLPDFPEEERWGMVAKLRSNAFELTASLADGYGSIDPRDKKYYFGHARKHAFGLKNTLLVAHKTNMYEANPSLIASLNKITQSIDREINQAEQDIPAWLQQFEVKTKEEK
jgi:four helix bundle protein